MLWNRKHRNRCDHRRLAMAVIAVALLMILVPSAAFAYIDPGTGSFIVQGIIAAVVGIGVAVKIFWHRIRRIFGGDPVDLDDDPDDDLDA